jgi:hypothetical protein
MNIREGFRRIARVTAWLYWICVAALALLFIAYPTTAPRSEFSLRGPDGQTWQVSGYDQAKAQAFLNRSVAPMPNYEERAKLSGNPWDAYPTPSEYQATHRDASEPMSDDEPDHADTQGAWNNVVIELGVALAIYVVGLALFRALRWIARGFVGDGPTALERAIAAENQRTLDGILNYKPSPD